MDQTHARSAERVRRSLPSDLFRPTRIAIVGATETPGPAANIQLTLDTTGFAGEIVPVNPNRETVFGRRAHRTLRDVPGVIDLAIVMVRPERVVDVVRDAAASRVANLLIYSAGFAELGREGATAQAEIRALAESAGIRVLGPNCIGFVNPADGVVALVVPPASVPAGLHAGGAALVSQSGGLLISTMEYASQIGVGFRVLASTGNEADVSVLDVLESVLDDPAVRCVGLISEGIPDGRRLVELGRRAGSIDKPIVSLKLGRSAKGAASVATHTAALAGSDRVFAAASAEVGIATVETIAQLVDHLALLEKRRRPRPSGDLAVLTISGGTKALVADLAERYGLRLAELGDETVRRLAAVIPDIGVGDNPLDITAAAIEDSAVVEASVRALAQDPHVGAIALVMHLRKGGGSPAHQRLVRAFTGLQAELEQQLIVVSSIPEGISGAWRDEAAAGDVPFLNDLSALAAIRLLSPRTRLEARAPAAIKEVQAPAAPPPAIADALAAGATTLGEIECQSLLLSAGIGVPRGAVARSADEARGIAADLHGPVVLKVIAAGLAHKTDAGGVLVGISGSEAVTRAFEEVTERVRRGRPDLAVTGVLVQEAIPEGPELLVGISHDPQFGAVVSVGLGGILTELLDDVVLRLAPIDRDTAASMLQTLRGARIFDGWRGRPVVSLDAAAAAISRISFLAVELAPWVASLEVNPLILTPSGPVAVDGLLALRQPPVLPDGP